MKKALILLPLVFVIVFISSTIACAQMREALQWVSAFEVYSDGIIALSDGQLYNGTYEEEIQEWKFEEYPSIMMPIEAFTVLEEGAVAVISGEEDTIYTLKNGKVVEQTDWRNLDEEFLKRDVVMNVMSFTSNTDGFYVLFGNEYQLDQSCLMRLDRHTKQVQCKMMKNLRAIKNYGTDVLLLYFYNPYDMQSRPTLAQMNCNNWEVKIIYETDNVIGGVSINEDKHELYFSEQGELKRIERDGLPETVAYTRASWDSTQGDIFYASYCDEQYLYINSQRELEIECVQHAHEIRVLRIAGAGKDTAYTRFTQKYPDVHVVIGSSELSATQIQLEMTAGLKRADLFVVDIYNGYQELRDKGYIAPLQSDVLSNFVQEMYPVISRTLMLEKELVAIPSYFSMMPWAVNETLWKEIFGDRTYPATYAQLLDLLEQWPEVYAEAYPEVSLIEFGGSNTMLLQMLVQQYILQQAHTQEAITFDDPQMAELFHRILELDREAVESNAQEEEFIAQKKLISFSPMCEYGICYEGEDRIIPILPPVLHDGERATVPVQMRVYVLNPLSEVKDLAIAYLEEVSASYSEVMKASILKDWNETHLSEWAQREMKRLVVRCEELEEAIRINPENEQLHMELHQCESSMRYIEQYGYDVSQESIELYRFMATHMEIPLDSPYWGEENIAMKQMSDIILRMADGQTEQNQALREMNRISYMIFAEGM